MKETCNAVMYLSGALAIVFVVMTLYLNHQHHKELEEICPNYELYLDNAVKNDIVFNQCIASARDSYNSESDDDMDDIVEQCRYHADTVHPTFETARVYVSVRAIHHACRKGKS